MNEHPPELCALRAKDMLMLVRQAPCLTPAAARSPASVRATTSRGTLGTRGKGQLGTFPSPLPCSISQSSRLR